MRDFGSRGSARASKPEHLTAAQVNVIVRRLGHVAHVALTTMMSNVIRSGDQQLAEALNDALKPCVDYMLHFDVARDGNAQEILPST